MTWKTSGLVRRRLSRSPAQYQEVKACVGAAWEATSVGVLPRVSYGSYFVWRGDLGAHGDNESEDRGSACKFF